MREGWIEVRLNEAVWFQRGFDLPRDNFEEGLVPVYGSTSILGYHNESKVKGPGVITGRYGTLGKFQLTNRDYWPHNTTLWVKDFKGNDVFFCYYMLHCLDFSTLNTGGAVPTLNRNLLNSFIVNLPPLPTQRRIASILSAYDDLIENNLRRIKLLEELAQITYEEWFVRFRIDGEPLPIDKETGLPVGWREDINGNVCAVSGGGTPSRSEPAFWDNGTIKWFSPTDLSKSNSIYQLDSADKITELGLKKSSAKLLGDNSFMMTSRATIGLFGLIDTPFSTNQGFINVTPFEAQHKEFLFYNFMDRVPEFTSHASGATFPEISKSKFKALKINWPYDSILQKFHNRIGPIHQLIGKLTNQNRLLKEARDILLPRLMTGVIDDSEIQVEMTMAAEDIVNYEKEKN